MSLSQALVTAVAGLRTAQAGLSLVAANVSNAQTPGYIRKTLDQQTTAAGDAGVSVRVSGINRELDQYLQRQLRVESSGGAYADLRSQFYGRLQQVYGDPSSASALETLYNNFTTAAQALSTNPSDYSARSSVLSTGQVLAQQLNGLTGSIQGLRSDAEQGLADAVRSANTAMQRIAEINQQLAMSHADDAAAATLLDQRDQYVDQLAQLMDIRTGDGDFNQISVFTSSGIQLVGSRASTLSFDPQGTMTPNAVWDADPTKRNVGTITLVSPTGASMDLIANKSIRSGQIAAYLEMRDQVLVQAQTQLDQIAASVAQTLSDHTTDGISVTNGPQSGYDIDVTDLKAGNSVKITYTDTATNTQHTLTLMQVDDPSALPLPDSATPAPNDRVIGVDFRAGVGAVANQLNNIFNGKIQFSNSAGNTLRVLDDGAAGTSHVNSTSATFTVSSLTSGMAEFPFFLDASAPYTGAISGAGTQMTGFAGRIAVNAALVADPSKLVVFQITGGTSGDPTRPNFIYDRLTSASLTYSPQTGVGTKAAPFSGPLPSFIRQVLSQQGDAAQAASNLSSGQDMVVNALKQRFNDGSSVNIDQEMSNLLTLQTAYGANARVLSAVKDMIDTLLKV